MKKPLLTFYAILALASAIPVLQTGCQSKTTVEQGGAYSDAVLAVTDQAILDASHTMTAFVQWAETNKAYLSKYPEVGNFSVKVAMNKDGWVRDAYAARDSYALALVAYRAAKLDSAGVDAKRAQMNATLAVLANITAQLNAYKQAHNA